jgi:POT family proton-dependent oligopeptide transporter
MEQQNSEQKSPLREIIDPFIHFAKAPRALWGINIPYVIEGLVYFGILTILGKYCSENVALSDLHAGWVYGAVTGGITFAMLLFGGVSDKIGVRKSLVLSLSMMMIGRIIISISGTLPLGSGVGSAMFLTMLFGLLLMVIAYGLYQPAAYAGVKRYTTPKTAAMGYAVIYALMNLGAFFSGFISPLTRHNFESVFPPNGLTAVYWVYAALTLVAVLSTIFILSKKTDEEAVERVRREKAEMRARGEKVEDDDSDDSADQPKVKAATGLFIGLVVLTVAALILFAGIRMDYIAGSDMTAWIALVVTIVSGLAAGYRFLSQNPDHPLRDSRFVFFIFILIPVQTLFAHNWLTIPYYLDRAFAGTFVGEYFEFFSNLNPILIFFLAPIIAALTSKADVYRMMILGTFVMAAPTFLLVIGPNAILFVLYIVLMTIGEAMWQPRFLQWIAEIAPKGKTGAYMGIGQLPWFLTKLITATYSGYFVANYIPKPEDGLEPRTGEMWLYYGLIAILSPIALVLARKWMGKGLDSMNKNKTN